MKRFISVLFILTLVFALVPRQAAAEGEPVRYTVVFNGTKIPKKAADMIADAGGELVLTLDKIGVGVAVSNDPNFAESLKGARGIHSVGQVRFHSLPTPEVTITEATEPDPDVDGGYYALQWDIRRVKANQAWDISTGSHDTVVAVLDTGIAYNHPDLEPNIVHNACYSLFISCQPYPSYHWHGTHVAGTIAANFGGAATVGVGPNLGLANYNVFEFHPDFGFVAFDPAIWQAMLDVAARGYEVINMSLGGYIVRGKDGSAAWTAWNRVANYVTRQGVTIVASSGNAAFDLNGPVDHIPSDVTGVISVGATGIRPNPVFPQPGFYDVRASYSNYGSSVTLSAPGGDLGPEGTTYPFPAVYYLIYSDYVFLPGSDYYIPGCEKTASCLVGYAWAGGTSMASPHVAGAAGLVKDVNPMFNPQQVTKVLKQTAENLGDRQQFGHGMLDVYEAVKKADK